MLQAAKRAGAAALGWSVQPPTDARHRVRPVCWLNWPRRAGAEADAGNMASTTALGMPDGWLQR
jgi:hypothetical protein